MKIKILAAGIALTLPFWACAKDVTIIYTNDLHAHVCLLYTSPSPRD